MPWGSGEVLFKFSRFTQNEAFGEKNDFGEKLMEFLISVLFEFTKFFNFASLIFNWVESARVSIANGGGCRQLRTMPLAVANERYYGETETCH